jgi:hypothetical protein
MVALGVEISVVFLEQFPVFPDLFSDLVES